MGKWVIVSSLVPPSRYVASVKYAQVAVNDNAVEAVINEDEKIAEQLGEKFHGRSPKTHQAWSGQAHGRRQGLSSR
jgi:hypothetical protein